MESWLTAAALSRRKLVNPPRRERDTNGSFWKACTMVLTVEFLTHLRHVILGGGGQRDRPMVPRWAAAIALPFVVANAASVCFAGKAHAESDLSALVLGGRWVDEMPGDKFVLDISSCGEGWCGVNVVEGVCGATVLRVKQSKEGPEFVSLSGKLELAPRAQPYFVQARIFRTNDVPRLQILGDSGADFSVMRRSYPFVSNMARSGDALCRPDAKTS
ncbi:hypothetical protein NLM33_26445 [Bradyrhizobium sp. CCGUVB1N3]|uniref:hypothetical protein n=1 Tax=Bradyrhizobium sp. CCGUVB1N3 TaxID=2949629 RepID=UPI0020B34444|nr:hypothetical protein [Bradyrhizobium sp. CCGUVB1N3]MCP3473860.1 hypothetical protein [Bradyrhizobium sp. CCGUVB1N3]